MTHMLIPEDPDTDSRDRFTDDEASLVQLARVGEDDAFAELVRRHQRPVYLLARSLVRDAAEAEDMTQEAFLRASRNLDLLADPGRFGVWLRRITFGVCVDWLRKFRPQLFRSTDARPTDANGHAHDGAALVEELGDPAPSPFDALAQRELTRRVMSALDRLPARYRVPLTLYHIDGLSHARVAAALGVSAGTVRSLVSRARRRLAAGLASSEAAGDDRPARAYGGALGGATAGAAAAAPATTGGAKQQDPGDVLAESALAPRFMHVLNGDVVREKLERSDLPGAFAVWADILHEGPVPAASGTPQWRDARARFIARTIDVPYADAFRRYEEWDATLARAPEYDEVVLWFEHDLFDQLLLVRHLDWFARQAIRSRPALGLICIGEYPGIEPFHGLGQLAPDQLVSLLGTRQRVTAEMLRTGGDVWQAFTGDDPLALQAIADRLSEPRPPSVPNAATQREREATVHGTALPFLAGALRRFLEEYPSRAGGLPRTERVIAQCLRGGPLPPIALFRAAQRREERVFMGDSTFWARLRTLAAGPVPLVAMTDVNFASLTADRGHVQLTDAGRNVLDGDADWVMLCGFDRWLGGVHLAAAPGSDVPWRWDPDERRVVPVG